MRASVVDRSHRLIPHLKVLHSYLRLLLGMQGLPGESFEVALVDSDQQPELGELEMQLARSGFHRKTSWRVLAIFVTHVHR
jgi:hypothetical protein